MSDFEVVGMSDADKRAWQAALGLPVMLASGEISSPTLMLDFALPSGYAMFKVELGGVNIDTPGSALVGAFSSDAGATFDNDFVSNVDTYVSSHYESSYEFLTSSPIFTGYGRTCSPAVLSQNSGYPSFDSSLQMTIWPGSADGFPRIEAIANTGRNVGGSDAPTVWYAGGITYNPNAVVPPVLGRRNLFRLIAGASGWDVTAPEVNFVRGYFWLQGWPEP